MKIAQSAAAVTPGGNAKFELRNQCGKDITALTLADTAAPEKPGRQMELLGGLMPKAPIPPPKVEFDASRIFRSGSAYVSEWPEPTPDGQLPRSLAVTSIIFCDRSSLGDPKWVDSLVSERSSALRGFRKMQEILDPIADFDAAKLAFFDKAEYRRERRPDLKTPEDQLRHKFCERITSHLNSATPDSWREFYLEQQESIRAHIQVLSIHTLVKPPARAEGGN